MANKRPRQYDSRVYKPQKTEVNGEILDSAWEASVYTHLLMLGDNVSVRRQVVLPVLPASDYFPALDWKVDFQVNVKGLKRPIYVEAKGVFTEALKLKLQALGHTDSGTLSRCIFVSSQGGICVFRGCRSVDLNGMMKFLRHLIDVGKHRSGTQHNGLTIS